MSKGNNSGGGCMLWFINWIFNIFRKKRITKYNQQARGVQESPPAFVSDHAANSLIQTYIT